MNAILTGVGVGPGDPELLTLKAIRLIQSAPVLAYTVDEKGESYARRTAAGFIRTGQEELPLRFSMSPDREERVRARQEAGGLVREVLESGRGVVFITEGDPLLYSTFQHLMAAMPAGMPVEVCPGISALNAAAAAARFSLAVEGETLVVAPAKAGLGQIRGWLEQGSSVVLFKAGGRVQRIKAGLLALDKRCTTVLVERVSTGAEMVLRDIEEWPDDGAPYFSIILIRPHQFSIRRRG